MPASRNQICNAILALLQTMNPTQAMLGDGGILQPTGDGTLAAPVSQRLKTSEQTDAQPALFLLSSADEDDYPLYNGPARQVTSLLFVLYSRAGADPSIVPAVALNDLLDRIESAIRPGPHEQTLGGLVTWVRFKGRMTLYRGDQQQQAITSGQIDVMMTV